MTRMWIRKIVTYDDKKHSWIAGAQKSTATEWPIVNGLLGFRGWVEGLASFLEIMPPVIMQRVSLQEVGDFQMLLLISIFNVY